MGRPGRTETSAKHTGTPRRVRVTSRKRHRNHIVGHINTAPDRRTRPAQGRAVSARALGGRELFTPYASWLTSGDNAWQMTAATLVGLMSIPALAVLYSGLVPRHTAAHTLTLVLLALTPS